MLHSASAGTRRHTLRGAPPKRPVVRPGPGVLGAGALPDVDTWRAAIRDCIVEMDATPLGPVGRPDYTGWVYVLGLGPISVTDTASDPVRVARTSRLIRHNPVDLHHLLIARRPNWAEQNGRRTRLETGDAVFLDSDEPYSVTGDGFGHILVVNVPRAALRRSLDVHRDMLGQRLPAENSSLRVLRTLLTEVGREASGLPDDTVHELGHTAGELVVSALRLAQAAPSRLDDAGLSRATQLARMKDFVRRHLDDPDLSPRVLAAAFSVSVRYVELVFRESGVSPSRFIRESRLAEARRMLADPRQRNRSIAAVARSVGIESPSVFARTFRSRFETTPRDFRRASGHLEN